MRRSTKCIALLLCLVAAAGAFGAEKKSNYVYSIKDGLLYRGEKNITSMLYAIEIPDLYAAYTNEIEEAKALSKLSEPGANALCFDLKGYSADGKTLPAELAANIDALLEPVTYRHIGSMCRVLPAGTPTDADFRLNAVKAAAEALKGERRLVYVIDGPKSKELVEVFHKTAPGLIVAGDTAEADVVLVKNVKEVVKGKPGMLVGQVPDAKTREQFHCLMPAGDASYAAFEKAMQDPAETKPWKPDNSLLSEEERADGWISLFNGKDLDGWWILGPKKDGFVVKDGCIVWNASGGRALYTRDRYENYVLRIEWKIDKGGNSGLYMRAPRANRQSKIGMEIQIQGDHDDPQVTNQTTGAIYSAVAPKLNATKPEGEWNSEEITCDGSRIKIMLNGQLIQDTNLDDTDDLKMRLRKGFIGLQDHYCKVAFRNIRIKKLP